MNRNLYLSLLLLVVALALPFGSITLQLATSKWPIFWQIRSFLINYSGIVTMILMSLTVILSVKHWPMEKWLRGLDQQYRLHKYLGIITTISAFMHWLSFLSDDIAMEQGYIITTDEKYPFWKLIEFMGDPAQFIGEWAFYLTSAFVLIAWLKYFPHRFFQYSHKFIPYIYLLLVIHMLIFLDSQLWLSLPGLVLATTVPLASIASLLTIFDLNGKANRSHAVIEEIAPYQNGVKVTMRSTSSIQSYRSGQFAFVGFDKDERAHPFSLASKNIKEGLMHFLIQANGDYTNTLTGSLELGQTVELEGPYGCFDFDDQAKQQIWVAGGIGIAPFMAALEDLKHNKHVDLFYTYNSPNDSLLTQLKERAHQANVTLHLINTNNSSWLTPKDVLAVVKDICECSVWYCGPLSLGEKCEQTFYKAKLPRGSFHRELFDFR
ncbi:MAG: ferric reductase-like transmembrane domain-containing protein [Oceanospirillaceae bacterium]